MDQNSIYYLTPLSPNFSQWFISIIIPLKPVLVQAFVQSFLIREGTLFPQHTVILVKGAPCICSVAESFSSYGPNLP